MAVQTSFVLQPTALWLQPLMCHNPTMVVQDLIEPDHSCLQLKLMVIFLWSFTITNQPGLVLFSNKWFLFIDDIATVICLAFHTIIHHQTISNPRGKLGVIALCDVICNGWLQRRNSSACHLPVLFNNVFSALIPLETHLNGVDCRIYMHCRVHPLHCDGMGCLCLCEYLI